MPATPTPDVPPATELRDLAVSVAREAAALLEDALHRPRESVSTKSSGTDMVTEMDAASERLLVDRISAARPEDAIVGEEGADRSGTTGVRWVIDPLDGTTNYLYRLPGWNVSIGVEVEDRPVAGAVLVPGFRDEFAAAEDAGATRNGEQLLLGGSAPLAEALVGTGFSYDREQRRVQAAQVTALIADVRDVRRIGAAATDLCGVACGRLDAFYETGLAAWDRSAGTIIAREAGARVEVVAGNRLDGVLTLACHPALWGDFTALLARAGVLADGDAPAEPVA